MWDRKERSEKSLKDLVEEEKEPMTQLNVEIPVYLHRKLKITSAEEGVKIREVVIRALEKEFFRSQD